MHFTQFPGRHLLNCQVWERRLIFEEVGQQSNSLAGGGQGGILPLPRKPVELLVKIRFKADFFPLFPSNSRKTLDLYLTARAKNIKCRPERDGRVAQLVRARR